MRKVRSVLVLLAVLAFAAFLVVSGIVPRLRARQTLRKQTDITAEPPVLVLRPKRGKPGEELILPANMQAFVDAPIYARTNGYLKKWYFDMGSRVKQGALLAVIESPEVDQQLQQAREDLRTAEANLKLSQITAQRYSDLLRSDSVAKQDVDNAVQDAAAKAATVKSAQANVRRLEQMVGFEQIVAPFNGVITARNTDVGQLIESGPAGGPGKELFHVAAIDKLRVFANVPQVYSHQTRPGMKADLTLPEMPGRRFTGMLVRTADAIDPATRTLLVEVDVINSTGLLFPGAYSELHFNIKANATSLIIPSSSLVFRSEGLRVPTVINGNCVHFVNVTVGRDFGNTVEVLTGLPEDANVVANPPDSLVEGEIVRVVPARNAEPE